jgi:tetratricopeptide (TPR) repeat protein
MVMAAWAIGVSICAAQTPGPPPSPEARQAVALDQQGRFADAAEIWRAEAQRNPRDAMAWASLGLDLARQSQYPEAVTAYEKALKLNPRIPGLQLNLGLAFFKQGKLEEAIPSLQQAVAADPHNEQASILLGMSDYGTQRYEQAIPHLRVAVDRSPGNLELRNVLAQSCLYAKQYNCVLDEYKQILQANPDSAPAHMLAGEALDGMNQTTQAIAEFQAAEKVAPTEPNVHFGLGYLLWKQHRYQDAAEEFRKEIVNEPMHAQALAYLGDSELKMQHAADAEAILRRAVHQAGAIPMAWLDLGIVLADQGKNDEAISDFKQAIRLDPNGVDAHWRLARLDQTTGKTTEARAEFAKARALHEKEDKTLVRQMSPPSGPPAH